MNLLSGIVHLDLDNLIADTRFLLLSALGVFLPRECGNFNRFKRRVRYLWHYLLLVYIEGYINRVSVILM